MARTTADLVKEVLAGGRDYDTRNNPSLTQYIQWATLVTNRVADCAVAGGDPFSAEELAALETWLAAHAYKMSDRPYKKKRTASAYGEFDGETDMGLNATTYGQMALTLDRGSCLEEVAGGSDAAEVNNMRAYWLGRRTSEQTDYDQRS